MEQGCEYMSGDLAYMTSSMLLHGITEIDKILQPHFHDWSPLHVFTSILFVCLLSWSMFWVQLYVWPHSNVSASFWNFCRVFTYKIIFMRCPRSHGLASKHEKRQNLKKRDMKMRPTRQLGAKQKLCLAQKNGTQK